MFTFFIGLFCTSVKEVHKPMTCLPVATSNPTCIVSSHRTSRKDSGSPSMSTHSTHQVCMGAAPMDLCVAGLLLLGSQACGEAHRTLEKGGVQALSITCCVTFDKPPNLSEPI